MKSGKWQGRGAAAAPTVLVEQKAPLAKRLAGIAVVVALAGVLLVWGIDLGMRIFGVSRGAPSVERQLEQVQAELARMTAERDALLAAKQASTGVPDATGKTGMAPPSAVQALPEQALPEKVLPENAATVRLPVDLPPNPPRK